MTNLPPALECRNLSVAYNGSPVVSNVDLQVEPGETVALLGPSGSGKTTLLYAIAGFLPPSSGEIQLAGRLAAKGRYNEPPEKRPVAMVFQHYGLWPHLDALETVAYPLRRRGLHATPAREQARELLSLLQIAHLAHRRPTELSGGEQQRVGLARALARRPSLYLLDEPTAHLDTALKAELQQELVRRLREDGAAVLHATHDVEEALALAHRVALLRSGRIVQLGRPAAVYEQPVDEWAARLTGPVSLLEGNLEHDAGGVMLAVGGRRIALSLDGQRPAAGPGRFIVRPDWLAFGGPLPALVQRVAYRGSHTDYGLDTAAGELLLRRPGTPQHVVGDATAIAVTRLWRLD